MPPKSNLPKIIPKRTVEIASVRVKVTRNGPISNEKTPTTTLPVLSFKNGSSTINMVNDTVNMVLQGHEELLPKDDMIADEAEIDRKKQLEEEVIRQQIDETEKKIKGNGKVKLIYERYNEEFPIIDGCCKAEEIDEIYCLSFVMPNCLIHLSPLSPQERRVKEEQNPMLNVFIKEEPQGIFHDLEKDNIYYVYVEQAVEQLARDQERMRQIALQMEGAKLNGPGKIGMDCLSAGHWESCTCIYGTPCLDE